MKTLILTVLLLGVFTVHAQFYTGGPLAEKDVVFELGGSAGLMNCRTDIGGTKGMMKNFKPSGGFYAGVMYKDFIGVRFQATWGSIAAQDSIRSGKWARSRNLSFASDITEIAFIAEIHPLILLYDADGSPRLSPYLAAGLGSFSFNPKTYFQGKWIYLQPLHLEGQGFPEYKSHKNYKLSQLNLPVGGGLRFKISDLFTVRGEMLYRFLRTDYLDDVSTTYIDPANFDKHLSAPQAFYAKQLYFRGDETNPESTLPKPGAKRGEHKSNDGYFTVNINLGITLGR